MIPEMMFCVHIKSGYDSRDDSMLHIASCLWSWNYYMCSVSSIVMIWYDLKSAFISSHESSHMIP